MFYNSKVYVLEFDSSFKTHLFSTKALKAVPMLLNATKAISPRKKYKYLESIHASQKDFCLPETGVNDESDQLYLY